MKKTFYGQKEDGDLDYESEDDQGGDPPAEGGRRVSNIARTRTKRYTPSLVLLTKSSSKVLDPDNPTLSEALSGDYAQEWKRAIKMEISMLQKKLDYGYYAK